MAENLPERALSCWQIYVYPWEPTLSSTHATRSQDKDLVSPTLGVCRTLRRTIKRLIDERVVGRVPVHVAAVLEVPRALR